MNESVTLPYRDSNLRAMYQVSSGTVPFKGATIAGETRELCGSTLGFGVITASASRFQDCLPAKLGRSGYQTTAVHGFSGRMFKRVNWYQRAQFHEVWFQEQLEAQKLPICLGPFPGICDAAVSHWIGDRLQQNGSTPQFIYWVTLNSHLPVPVPNGVEAAPACSEIRDAKDDRAICSWFQLIYNVHRSILNLAMRPMSRPTVFVIVGDHAPPFSSPELRARFSAEVVPYIILQPKKAINAPGPSDRPVMLAAHSKGKPSRKKDGLVGLAESF